MPFGSYEVSPEEALKTAIRFVKVRVDPGRDKNQTKLGCTSGVARRLLYGHLVLSVGGNQLQHTAPVPRIDVLWQPV